MNAGHLEDAIPSHLRQGAGDFPDSKPIGECRIGCLSDFSEGANLDAVKAIGRAARWSHPAREPKIAALADKLQDGL
jgi:hypothetical protein